MAQNMSADDEKHLDPETSRIVAKVRRLMMIASVTTFIAVAVVIGVIGYRVFRGEGRAPQISTISPTLPVGAKVLSSAIGEGRLGLTVGADGGARVARSDPDS